MITHALYKQISECWLASWCLMVRIWNIYTISSFYLAKAQLSQISSSVTSDGQHPAQLNSCLLGMGTRTLTQRQLTSYLWPMKPGLLVDWGRVWCFSRPLIWHPVSRATSTFSCSQPYKDYALLLLLFKIFHPVPAIHSFVLIKASLILRSSLHSQITE